MLASPITVSEPSEVVPTTVVTGAPVVVVINSLPTVVVPATPVGETNAVPTTDSSPKLTVPVNPVSVTIATKHTQHTTTVADGSADEGRAMYIKYTGTLDSTCTITIGPNTLKRVHIIENATSGSQSIIISQGSGANVTILTGETKVVYLDGAGSGAAVVDAFTDLSIPEANLTGTPTAPTASAGTNTTQLATTAYVTTAVGNAEPFPSGTSMLFQQTSAPTGWTEQPNTPLSLIHI